MIGREGLVLAKTNQQDPWHGDASLRTNERRTIQCPGKVAAVEILAQQAIKAGVELGDGTFGGKGRLVPHWDYKDVDLRLLGFGTLDDHLHMHHILGGL